MESSYCINLNLKKLTLKTGFVVQGHIYYYSMCESAPIMQFLRLLILIYECPKTDLHASKVKKHFSFLKNSFSFT